MLFEEEGDARESVMILMRREHRRKLRRLDSTLITKGTVVNAAFLSSSTSNVWTARSRP